MNDLVRGFRFRGHVHFRGKDIYHPTIDPVAVRRHIGMVFQQPNPFAMSIYRNVAFGLRLNGYKGDKAQKVEQALRGAALWDEVKDKLHKSALALSGGQQQRLCIARAIATEPAVLLMDEPCSALDPIATRKIEELMLELKKRFTIAIVTHNLQQAQRVADKTGFLYVDTTQGGRTGYLVEFGDSKQIFERPQRETHAGVHPRRVQLTAKLQALQPGGDTDHATSTHPLGLEHHGDSGGLRILLAIRPVAAQDRGPARRRAPARRRRHVPRALYEQWFRAYQKEHPELAVAYEAVGSGAGIKRFIGKSTDLTEDDRVDFGASDAAMTDAEIAAVDRGVRLVPMTAGAVVLAYNLPELQDDLKLTREAYSGIFLGEITRWNDPKIVATNPALKKAAMTIALVARRDASGTTYALTNHLSAISPQWRARFGAVQLVDWPGAAMRVEGNAGVAGRIKQSLGSIGYLELGFARRLGLKTAWLENKAGRFVRATTQSGRAALGSAALPNNLRLFFPDPDGPDSYPIVTLSWVLLYKDYADPKQAAAVRELFKWCLTEGQNSAEKLGYLRLSSNIVAPAVAAVESVGPK